MDGMSSTIKVIAYSGYQGEQEPRALVFDGERLDVLSVADRWYAPTDPPQKEGLE